MKAIHANPFLHSFANILQMVAGVEATKGDIRKGEGIESEKLYTMYFELEKGLKGFYAISFDEEVAMNLVEKMMGTRPEKLDEMGLSALKEVGEMVKGNAITEMSTMGIDCEAGETKFKVEEEIDSEAIILTMKTEFGDIDNHFLIRA